MEDARDTAVDTKKASLSSHYAHTVYLHFCLLLVASSVREALAFKIFSRAFTGLLASLLPPMTFAVN